MKGIINWEKDIQEKINSTTLEYKVATYVQYYTNAHMHMILQSFHDLSLHFPSIKYNNNASI